MEARWSGSSSLRCSFRLSSMRPCASAASSSLTRCPPGPHAFVLEGELVDARSHRRQCLRYAVLRAVVAVEEHEAAAARARDLAPERPAAARLLVHLVDLRVRDPVRHPL